MALIRVRRLLMIEKLTALIEGKAMDKEYLLIEIRRYANCTFARSRQQRVHSILSR